MPAAGQKRTATAAYGGDAPKKRKTEGMVKYYAVKAGVRPGVYMTYPECQAQTAGFKGAIFKSFTSREDAEAFVAGRKVAGAADAKPDRFYAVAVSNKPGIYTDWADVAPTIVGVKGPKYKKFSTRQEAMQFMLEHGNAETLRALGHEADAAAAATTATKPSNIFQAPADEPGVLRIYTDGSSRGNGKAGSRAGSGVFFGFKDPRNIAARLEGEPQTNQRAELHAIYLALEAAPAHQTVKICTDSQYSINCVTQWAASWKRKGWKTGAGEDVKNQDIIKRVLDKMEERKRAGGATLFQWVKGHAADARNEMADKLANEGAMMELP